MKEGQFSEPPRLEVGKSNHEPQPDPDDHKKAVEDGAVG
jgi:hypothetical protein